MGLDFRRTLARSRPRFWLYLAGPALVGLAYAADGIGDLLSAPAIALVAYFLVPANVYLYSVNDVYDADVDAENPKKEDREVRYRGERGVVSLVALTGVLGLALAVWLPRAAPWIVGFLALGWAYSAPPRLKTRPPLDSLSNGLYVLPGIAAYAALAGSIPPLLAVVGGWLWTMAMHTFSAIPDIAPDRRAGIDTTATVLGARRALAYCGACWLLAAVAFALLDPRAGLLFGVYPAGALALDVTDVDLSRAYWWFPALNTATGAILACAGLWGVLRG